MISSRFFQSATLLLVLAIKPTSGTHAQTFEELKEPRKWNEKGSGRHLYGEMINADLTSVELKIATKASATKVPLSLLDENEATMVKVAYLNKLDREQLAKVSDKLSYIQQRSKSVATMLESIHNNSSYSPYAGLWAAVALSAGENNDYKSATVILRDVIKRIESQQQVDPRRHRMTLCAAYNNIAICQIKDRKGNTAAASFQKSLDPSQKIPFIINHNALQLTELTDVPRSFINLSDKTRKVLLNTLATFDSVNAGAELEAGWYYCLDFDLPNESVVSQKIAGVDPPQSGMKLVAIGTGVVAAKQTVITSRSLIADLEGDGDRLLTVSEQDTNGQWISHSVKDVISTQEQLRATGSTVMNGTGGTITWTDFEHIPPSKNDVSGELSVLRVPGLRAAPAVFDVKDAPADTKVSLLGYARGTSILKDGVRSHKGNIQRRPNGEWKYSDRAVPITALINGGNRGGPVINENGVIVGIAYEATTETSDLRGLMLPVSQVRPWFNQLSALQELNSEEQLGASIAASKAATVPIFAWSRAESSDAKVYSRFVDASQIGGFQLLDDWCIACSGKGQQPCTNNACKLGKIVGSEPVVQGYNPLTKQNVYGSRPTYSKCETCDGHGKLPCPFCTNGKLFMK